MSLVAWRTRSVLIFTLALLALVAIASVGLAGEQSPMVVMIVVEGNAHVPTDEILAAVKRTQIGAPLNLDAVAADQKAIFELGYFAEMQAPEFRKALGGVKVVFRVVENPTLKEIKITGLSKMPVAEAVAVFTTKPGEVIGRNTVAKDLRRLMDTARDNYGLLIKSPSQIITPDGVIEITLVEMRLRNLSLIGLQKTKPEVVRREISVKEGEVFDLKAFMKDLQNLFMLGYFEEITPKFTEGADADALDVEVTFTEAKTGTVQFELSYIPADQEFAGAIKLGDANFFGSGNNVNVSVELNQDKRNYDFSFTDPWLDAKHTSLSMHLYNDFDAFVAAKNSANTPPWVKSEETLRGWELSLGRPLTKKLTVSVTGKQEYLNRAEVENWPTIDDPDNPGNTIPDPAFGTIPSTWPEVTPGGVNTNSVSLQLQYKDLTPQKAKYVYVADGIKASLNVEFAGGVFGGDTQFNRYSLESSFFKSVSPRDVFALRLKGGLVDATDDPMKTANFITGGSESLRGYDYRAFSSTQMGLANLEFRHRFNDTIEGVVFYDTGKFYSTDEGWQSGSDYGLGLRIWIPYLGQIRLDYGCQVGTDSKKFCFSLGEMF